MVNPHRWSYNIICVTCVLVYILYNIRIVEPHEYICMIQVEYTYQSYPKIGNYPTLKEYYHNKSLWYTQQIYIYITTTEHKYYIRAWLENIWALLQVIGPYIVLKHRFLWLCNMFLKQEKNLFHPKDLCDNVTSMYYPTIYPIVVYLTIPLTRN